MASLEIRLIGIRSRKTGSSEKSQGDPEMPINESTHFLFGFAFALDATVVAILCVSPSVVVLMILSERLEPSECHR